MRVYRYQEQRGLWIESCKLVMYSNGQVHQSELECKSTKNNRVDIWGREEGENAKDEPKDTFNCRPRT